MQFLTTIDGIDDVTRNVGTSKYLDQLIGL